MNDPLQLIDSAFSSSDSINLLDVRKPLLDFIQQNLNKIPLITENQREEPAHHSLVRLRAMVHDMSDPEFYPAVFVAGPDMERKTMLFRDRWDQDTMDDADDGGPNNEAPNSAQDLTSEPENLGTRLPLTCVPIPGESDWVLDTLLSSSVNSSNRKRRLADDSGEPAQTRSAVQDRGRRRRWTVKLYPPPTAASTESVVKLQQCAEFYGVYSRAAVECGSSDDSASADLVPTVHCVCLRLLDELHPDIPSPVFCSSVTVPPPQPAPLPAHQLAQGLLGVNVDHVRSALVDQFAQAVGGDRLAAEYLLLHLLSKVYRRTDILCLGKFSLRLTVGGGSGPNDDSDRPLAAAAAAADTDATGSVANRVYEAVQSLLVQAKRLTLDNQCLQQQLSFSPSKNFALDTDSGGMVMDPRLLGSLGASGSYLLVDERADVNPAVAAQHAGVRELSQLLQEQTVVYTFGPHCQTTLPMDVRVLVCSRAGAAPLLPTDITVALDPSHNTTPANGSSNPVPAPFHPSHVLDACRLFIARVRALDIDELSPAMREQVQDTFVAERQLAVDQSTVPPDQITLHHWLTLARLYALSCGQTSVTEDHWKRVIELERARSSRL